VVGAEFKHGVADEPLDEQVEADLAFELAGRPVEEVAHEKGAEQTRRGMGGWCARPGRVMIGRTCVLEWFEVEVGVQATEQMIVGVRQ
jgi:hypothetical protein